MSANANQGQAALAGNQPSAPLVSVIIPTYNRARDLARALESVLSQSIADWEAIVVDNHSSDDTDAVVIGCRDARIRLLKIHNQGIIAASRNLGLHHARGHYVAFLDSDDWWAADKLAQSVRELDAGADVVYHDAWLVSKADQTSFRRRGKTWSLCEPVAADLIARGNALVNSTVVLRRDLLLQIGGLCESPELVAIEDYDAWIRLALLGARFVRLPRVLAYYWVGGGNTSNPQRLLAITAALVERHHAAFDLVRKSRGRCWLELAWGEAKLRLGDHAGAIQSLLPYLGSGAPWRWQAKALLLLVRALMRVPTKNSMGITQGGKHS
jgi:glycosyltransferase involved in cell wall biosynthesis